MTEYIINPTTSRPVAVGSRTYNNLVRDGVIQGEGQAKKTNKNSAPKKTIKKTKKQVVYESEEDDEFESEPTPLARTKSVKAPALKKHSKDFDTTFSKSGKKESVNIPMDEYKILLNMMKKNKQDEYEYSEDESEYSEDDE